MPDTIQRKGWDCAESVELNQWTFEMQKLNLFGKKRTDGVTTSTLLHSVANVRHTAVHRRRVSMAQIDKFFTDALALLGFFEAEEGRKAVVALRQEITTLLACGTNEQRELPGDSCYSHPASSSRICIGATATRPGALIGAMLYEHWEFQVFPPIQGSKRVRLDLVVNLEHIKRAAGDSEPKKFAFREGDMLSYDPIIPALALAFSDGAFLNCFSTPEAIYNLKVPPNRTDFAFCGKKNGKDAPYFETFAPQQDLIHLAARLQRHDAAPTCLTEEQLAEVNEEKDLKALRLARTNAMQTWKAQGYRSRDAAAGTTMREDYDRYSKEAENLSKYLKGIRLRQFLEEFHTKIHVEEIDRQLRGIKPADIIAPPSMEHDLPERAHVAQSYAAAAEVTGTDQLHELPLELIGWVSRLCSRRESRAVQQNKRKLATRKAMKQDYSARFVVGKDIMEMLTAQKRGQ
ncbi:hypothetical protein MY4038_006586 [Beauveria bassiana]